MEKDIKSSQKQFGKILHKDNRLEVKFHKVSDKARPPTHGSDGSACWDLYGIDPDPTRDFNLRGATWTKPIKTGWAVEVPKGYVMKVYSRSGMGFNYGVSLANSTGIIDSDYRGEIMISLINPTCIDVLIDFNKAIAQFCIEKVIPLDIVFTDDELSETERGDGGFGSTDAVTDK